MDKLKQMQDIMKLQKTIAEAREAGKDKQIPVEVIEEKEVVNTLPTTYISANQLKLSAKELTHKVSYLDRLRQDDDRYDKLQISEEKAKKIRRGLTRLTTGTAAVVPLKCNGSECSFKATCLTGDTKILVKGGKYKELRYIQEYDLVYSFNIKKRTVQTDVVTAFKHMGEKDVYKITTRFGNTIEATVDHPFLCETNNGDLVWNTIDNSLAPGSTIVVEDFDQFHSDSAYSIGDCYGDIITQIEKVGIRDVYDITVKNNSNFIANNFVVHNCPYYLEGVAPVGLACLVELQLIEYWMEKYQNEFNIDDNSITDMHMISRLCEYDVYDMRVTRYLAENDQTLLVDFISSYSEDGDPISNKATSAAFEVKERIDRLRSKTLKELMATREAKAKILTTVANGSANMNLAQMKQKFDDLVKEKTDLKVVNH